MHEEQPEPLRALHILIEIQTLYDGGPMLGGYVEWATRLTNGIYVSWNKNHEPEPIVEIAFTEDDISGDDGLVMIAWRYWPDYDDPRVMKQIKDAEILLGS